MAAGLLDRAEMLLKEVIAESAELRNTAQRFLLDIYQDEREWQQAIRLGEALLGSRFFKSTDNKRLPMMKMIAHFYCELAEEDRLKGNETGCKKNLEQALIIDKSSLRASLLLGRFHNQAGQYKPALKVLNKAISENSDFIADLLPDLLNAYEGAYGEKGFERFLHDVNHKLANKMPVQGLLFTVDQQLARADRYPKSSEIASVMLTKYLHDNPSLVGLNKLITLRLPSLTGGVASEVRSLHDLLKKMLDKRFNYRCINCGFSGRQLHWRCPSCKKWDQMSRLKNSELE
jgi:lipopolysaccharide biosynthesis regulator YciM